MLLRTAAERGGTKTWPFDNENEPKNLMFQYGTRGAFVLSNSIMCWRTNKLNCVLCSRLLHCVHSQKYVGPLSEPLSHLKTVLKCDVTLEGFGHTLNTFLEC